VAKILVADDNSNVQKTMALALADLGVELVSVNNGEAAVRKLAEISPDLVLADIFMPVRNGYEVCEYVKKDSRFAHVPVILLVGAFDPLDEREAQRVGADGILKKPFVPPDPLITMVKTLLERSQGERLVAVSAPKTSVTVKVKTAADATSEVHVPVHEEPSPEESPALPGRVSFGEGDRPVAFGTLLETPVREAPPANTGAIEPVDDEQILTSSRDSTLGEPIFWRNDPPEAETEAESSADSSGDISPRKWGQEKDSPSGQEDAGLLQPIEPVEMVREEQEEAPASVADWEPVVIDQAAQASLTVASGKAPDLAANPLDWLATAPPQHTEAAPETAPGWDEPVADAPSTTEVVKPPTQSEPVLAPVMVTAVEAPDKVPPMSPQPPEDTAHSVSKDEWAEMTAKLEERASAAVTEHVASMSEPSAQIPVKAPPISQTAAVEPSQSSTPDPALVEAVVQRVIDKMRPQVVDIITKEFLRPVVQALVHREIEKS
jgi:CheY-like chemotaxis protein